MRVLVIGADCREFDGVLALGRQVGRLDWPVDWCASVSLGGRELLLAANGVGAARAARVLEYAPAADAVVSMGFCGALDPALDVGDVVVGECVRTASGGFPAGRVESPRRHTKGVVWSSPRVAQTAAEKATLRASGAVVVEMEAAGVADAARARNRPFFCIKVVTDLAQENLAVDFNAALRSDGHFDTMCILRTSLRRPAVCVPELLRLRRRCRIAAQVVGEFFADCRF